MQSYLRDLCGLCGLVTAIAGVACWSRPAAAVVAGLAAIGLSVLWARAAAAGKK